MASLAVAIVGVFVGILTLGQSLAILTFGLPTARQWLRDRLLTDRRPIARYQETLLLLAAILAVSLAGVWHFLPDRLVWFLVGLAVAVIGSLGALKKKGDLLADFLQANASSVRSDVLESRGRNAGPSAAGVIEFSERDLDRSWSAGELALLSERDLTKLAFRRALKNAVLFVPTAVVVGLIAGTLGLAGKIIGWLAIVGFALFALEPLAGFAIGVVAAVVGAVAGKYPRSEVPWRLLQLLVALAHAALYAGLAAWVYTRLKASG